MTRCKLITIVLLDGLQIEFYKFRMANNGGRDGIRGSSSAQFDREASSYFRYTSPVARENH